MDLEQALNAYDQSMVFWPIRVGSTVNFLAGKSSDVTDWVPVVLQSQAEVERYERWSGMVRG